MPELPEVETVRRYLQDHLPGKTIEEVQVFLPRLVKNAGPSEFTAALQGTVIDGVERKGKYLFLRLHGPASLLVHLRMTGRLLYETDAKAALPPYSHILFNLSQGRLLYGDVRTLGCLWLVPSTGPTGVEGYDTLGPDGNSQQFTLEYLQQALGNNGRTIKTFLLDQTCVAGLGNIYVDEALFAAGIRPTCRCNRLGKARVKRLHSAIGQVLAEGLAYGGTTIRNFINGSGREGQNQENLCVYGRQGQPCRKCGTTIVYMKLGGRGTHYCPHCQK